MIQSMHSSNQNGAFHKEANYLDAIEWHNGTNWESINNILPW